MINPCLVDIISNFLIVTANLSLGVPSSGTISFPFLRSSLASAPLALASDFYLGTTNGATTFYLMEVPLDFSVTLYGAFKFSQLEGTIQSDRKVTRNFHYIHNIAGVSVKYITQGAAIS
jgi:hypothetical protein